MKKFTIFILNILFMSGLSKAQIDSFYVYPSQTDLLYVSAQDSHFVAHNSSTIQTNKLVIFIGGTGSSPKRIKYFPVLSANEGFHFISIAYPNSVAAVTCDSTADINCFDNYRQELMFGTPVSGIISVDSLNCIYTRALKLVQYLSATYPFDGWSQYLNGNTFQWNKIITAGHSQGAGHAAYLSKLNAIDRVLMFSGANDYSFYYSAPAPWISLAGQTPATSFFSFLHLGDESIGYINQYINVEGFGMLSNGDDSTSVDNLAPPYLNSPCLYTNETPQIPGPSANHGSTVVDLRTPLDSNNLPLFSPVWRYMLNHSLVQNFDKQIEDMQLIIQNNLEAKRLNIEVNTHGNYIIKIFDINGKLVSSDDILLAMSYNKDISHLQIGLYFIQVSSNNKHVTRKFMICN